jgi:hypothetical protein
MAPGGCGNKKRFRIALLATLRQARHDLTELETQKREGGRNHVNSVRTSLSIDELEALPWMRV